MNSIFDHLSKFNNKTALIINKNEEISYKNLVIESEKIKIKIKSERSLIFVIGKNNLETLAGYLSFITSNNVVAFIDEKIDQFFLRKLLKIYKPDYIYCEKKKIYSNTSYSLILNYFNYSLLKKKSKADKKINNKLMLLMSTSGSTGSPKFVRQSYLNLKSNTESIVKFLKIKDTDKSITTLPITYVYGLSIINTHLYSGATIALNESSMVNNDFWSSLEKNKITSLGGVPYNYSILEKFFKKKINELSLRYTTHAGGKMNLITLKNIINLYKKNNLQLFSMYGAAEATARMSYLDWKYSISKIGSIGKPIPGGSFFLKNDINKTIIKPNTQGELIYKGANVCLGYSKTREDLNLGDTNKGILRTGDLATKDKDGFYFIQGRKDRNVKIYGMRVNLSELESILLDKGAESFCELVDVNKICINLKEDDKSNVLINYISKKTSIHPSVFSIGYLKKTQFNSNFKLKLSNN